jgi:hypothetical protein
MRRSLLTLAFAAAFGLFLTADASACCHKKAKCAEPVACAPAPVCEPAPVECAPAKKHCFKFPKFKLGCHKKAACEPAPVCETPVVYEAPVYAAPQAVPSAQTYATGQTR